jgi:acetyl-CoA carboxylase biotin carboxyl carrier protein
MSKTRASKNLKKPAKTPRTLSDSGSTNQSEMKTTEIRDLIDFISKSGLNEVDIETKELKLHVKREPDQKIFKSTPAPVVSAATVAPTAVTQLPQTATSTKSEKAGTAELPVAAGKKTVEIKSPMIGTFYRSGSPETPSFVSVGDKITKGQTVCIIEAMKLFNEIESEVSGTIIKASVENSSPVEYDQVLFVVEPD